MSSLYIVGYGKENLQNFTAFLQTELKTFIKQNKANLYNLKKLWKAEVSVDLLKKNARFILPFNKDTTCEYWGFFNVNDWDALYSNLFSHTKINELSYCQKEYYTFSRLKLLLQRFAESPLESNSNEVPYDFRIVYHSEMIYDSKRICVIEIDINSVCLDAYDFFYRMVCDLDSFFPNMFLSAYIDDSYTPNFDFKFDIEMLTKNIVNTGKAFYISNNLSAIDSIIDATILQQYSILHMKNGAWLMLNDTYKRANCDKTRINDLLIPQYTVVNWSNLSMQKHLRFDGFDTISVYYDMYSPTDPTLIISRGYTPIQLNCLAKEYGDLVLQEQHTKNYLLADF